MSLRSGLATIAVKLYPLLEHQSFQNTSLISYTSFWIGAIKLRKMDSRTWPELPFAVDLRDRCGMVVDGCLGIGFSSGWEGLGE